MPPFHSRELAVAVDMAGCPNRCRHCWLRNTPNRRMPVEALRQVAAEFRAWVRSGEARPFVDKLTVLSWYREPDYAENYRELWALEQALSDPGAARRFELLSIWRLARDESYAPWAREIGTAACQITLFGLEQTTDWFTRRPGYFHDALVATERLLAVGIRPRWQIILTTRALSELPGLVRLIESLELDRRVEALGSEFDVFLNLPSPDGEAFHIEDLRVDDTQLLLDIPFYLEWKTCQHFGRPTLPEALGRAEADWLPELLRLDEPLAAQPEILAFNVTPELDVYSNLGEPAPWWRLGNLRADGIAAVMQRFEEDAVPGLHALFHVPIADLARAYGRPGNRQVYAREDLVTRWVRLWSEGHWQITYR